MLDLAYVTLLDFLSRSPAGIRRDKSFQPQFVPFAGGEGKRVRTKDERQEASPLAAVACDRPEKSSRA